VPQPADDQVVDLQEASPAVKALVKRDLVDLGDNDPVVAVLA